MLRFAHSLSQLKWFQIQIKSNLAQPGLDFKRMERDERAAAGEEINETKWHIYILHVTSWHSAFYRAVLSLSYYWNVVDISNKILAFLRAYFLKLKCNILLGDLNEGGGNK